VKGVNIKHHMSLPDSGGLMLLLDIGLLAFLLATASPLLPDVYGAQLCSVIIRTSVTTRAFVHTLPLKERSRRTRARMFFPTEKTHRGGMRASCKTCASAVQAPCKL
jgi:hypothetical protein